MPKKFEYLCKEVCQTDYRISSCGNPEWGKLDDLGADGWELVNVVHISEHNGYDMAWFKREVDATQGGDHD